MKTPRIEDFDPNAAPQLGSPMDDFPSIEKPPAPSAPAPTAAPQPAAPPPLVTPPVPRTGSESKNVRLKESKKERLIDFLQTHLAAKADSVSSFRYPQSVVDLIEDVVNQVWQRHRKKITKTSVVVAAIGYLVWDFEQNGQASTLYRAVVAGDGEGP